MLPDTSLRLLQLVGLTLPAIALYMSVLIEIHMVTERKRTYAVSDPKPQDGSKLRESLEPDNFNIRYTDALRKTDFLYSSIGLIILLISGFLLLLSLVFQSPLLTRFGTGLIAASYAILGLSVLSTIRVAVNEIQIKKGRIVQISVSN